MSAATTGRTAVSRRTLLKGGLAVGTGLVVGFRLVPAGRQAALAQSGAFTPNQWISIDRDGLVTIINSVVEMGQGSITTMPAIVADELDTDLGKVKVVQAPANPKLYANPVTGTQSYGGSRGVRDHLEMLRKAGAGRRPSGGGRGGGGHHARWRGGGGPAAGEGQREAGPGGGGAPGGGVDPYPHGVTKNPGGPPPPYGARGKKAPTPPPPHTPP